MSTAYDTDQRPTTFRSTEVLDLPLARPRRARGETDSSAGDQNRHRSALVALVGATALVAAVAATDVGTGDDRPYSSVRTDTVDPFDASADTPATAVGGASVPRIRAGNSEELHDGDPVRLSGWNFGPGVDLSITQCVMGLVEPISNCYQGHHRHTVTTGPDGAFEFELPARRLLTTDSGVIDCADMTAGRCMVVVIADEARSPTATRIGGAVQLRYERGHPRPASADSSPPAAAPVVDEPEPGPAAASQTPSTRLPEASLAFGEAPRPGRRITVQGSGFVPRARIDSFVCSVPITRDDEFFIDPVNRCGWPADGLWVEPISIDTDGRLRGELVAPRSIELWSWDAPHNCVIQDCWLVVTTGDALATTPIGSVRLDYS